MTLSLTCTVIDSKRQNVTKYVVIKAKCVDVVIRHGRRTQSNHWIIELWRRTAGGMECCHQRKTGQEGKEEKSQTSWKDSWHHRCDQLVNPWWPSGCAGWSQTVYRWTLLYHCSYLLLELVRWNRRSHLKILVDVTPPDREWFSKSGKFSFKSMWQLRNWIAILHFNKDSKRRIVGSCHYSLYAILRVKRLISKR